jgi:hypothetical protein
MAFTAESFNSDEFKPAELHEKRAVSTGGTWKPSQRVLGDRGNNVNVCRDRSSGRSQDLPVTDILASSQAIREHLSFTKARAVSVFIIIITSEVQVWVHLNI